MWNELQIFSSVIELVAILVVGIQFIRSASSNSCMKTKVVLGSLCVFSIPSSASNRISSIVQSPFPLIQMIEKIIINYGESTITKR